MIPPVASLLNLAPEDMWEQLETLYKDQFREVKEELWEVISTSFNADRKESDDVAESVKTGLSNILFDQVQQATAIVEIKMKNRFERLFRYDDNMLPRKWREAADIRNSFSIARDKALEMLDLFAVYRLAMPTLKSATLRSGAFREEKTL